MHTGDRVVTEVVMFFSSEFPPIINDEEREDYKRLFDKDHQEYKELQAELDHINKRLAEVDRELDDLQEGSPQFLVWKSSRFSDDSH